MSTALLSLLEYFRPLATDVHEEAGAVTLLTPETNVLALNATYCLAGCPAEPRSRLLVGTDTLPGRVVARLRVGEYRAQPSRSAVTVEQVSRLQLTAWAGVLTAAYDTPGWVPFLARHLADKLEGDTRSVLLLAYADPGPVGALLWRHGTAHLWGSTSEAAALPLLNAAADLSPSPLLVSVPEQSGAPLRNTEVVTFSWTGSRSSGSRRSGS